MQIPGSRIRILRGDGHGTYCQNDVDFDSNCRFQQIDSEMTPIVNKVEIMGHPDNKITFDGSGFSQVSVGSTAVGVYRGVESDVML